MIPKVEVYSAEEVALNLGLFAGLFLLFFRSVLPIIFTYILRRNAFPFISSLRTGDELGMRIFRKLMVIEQHKGRPHG